MSEHSLPPDRSSWPSDPYRLLGVRPGVSPRDLRKAYLHLVRSHKPEHAPEEFRLIRAAYEALKEVAEYAASDDADDWSNVVDAPSSEPASLSPGGGEEEARPRSDPWDRAMRGEVDEAYRDLAQVASGRSAREEVYLQLYWLLETSPRLDPGRLSCDWLVRGLLDRGPGAVRLRALLTRAAESDPDLALADRFRPLLSPESRPVLLAGLCGCRWRAARVLGRWKAIVSDLGLLRAWVPSADADVWARLLIDAATNLAWAPEESQGLFKLQKREAEEFARQELDLVDELSLIEYAERASSGLNRLRAQAGFVSNLHDLLRLTWIQPTPAARARLLAHLAEVAANPVGWFWRLDLLRAEASAALQMLMNLPDQLGVGSPSPPEPLDRPEASSAVLEFLGSQHWWDYPSFRPHLLRFCLSEMLSPDVITLLTHAEPLLRLPDGRHLADAVSSDWPLAAVYRSCEIVRD